MYTPIEIPKRRVMPRPGHEEPIVYLAEDDLDLREALTAIFIHDGFVVRSAPDGTTLFDWLFRDRSEDSRLPDVIITDHRMPGYCSLDILDGLAEMQWSIPVIVITAYGPEVRNLARAHGASVVFEKPFDPDELCFAVDTCINWEVRRPRPRLVGGCPPRPHVDGNGTPARLVDRQVGPRPAR